MRKTPTALLLIAGLAGVGLAPPAQATRYGSFDVRGAIEASYLAACGPRGVLGLPLTNETAAPDRVGRFNQFQGGAIYWTPGTGAHEVHGAIRQTWAALRWESGPLGYPVTDESSTPFSYGRYNAFQRGSIYWSPTTGAHEVYGDIRESWAATGYENGPLGFPTSGEFAIPGGRMNTFQGGDVTWSPGGGARVTVNTVVPRSAPVPIPACAPAPVQPAPGTIVLTGSGTNVVGVNKPAGPHLVRFRTTGPTSSNVIVYSRVGVEQGDLLVNEIGATDQVVPLDFAVFSRPPQTTAFQVQSDTSWEITVLPLAAAGAFGNRATVGEARSTVYRYVGPGGLARITRNGGGYFGVIAYDADTSYNELLVNTVGAFDGFVPIEPNQYLEIVADGPWAITVV